jgi:non-specific serine/threonine protein kinase/serine/threonine-protein kinase
MPSHEDADKTVARRLRGDLDWIVMRCLEKERNRRYGTPQDLARDVGRYLKNEPVDAGPPTATYKVGKFVRRHRLGVGLTAAAAVATVGVTIALAVLLGQAREARAEADATRIEAEAQRATAEAQTAIATGVNDFLTHDLLGTAALNAFGVDVTLRELLDNASDTIVGRFNDQPRVAAAIRDAIANTYMHLDQPAKAVGHFDAAEALLSDLPPDDPVQLAARKNAAWARTATDLDESERRLAELLEPFEHVFGLDDPRTIEIRYNLAGIAVQRGDNAASVTLFEPVLAAQERTLDRSHDRLLRTRMEYASALRRVGRIEESLVQARRAFDDTPEASAEKATRAFALASSLRGLALPRDASPLPEPIARDSLSDEAREHVAEAERLLAYALDDRREYLGLEHPFTRQIDNLRAMLYMNLGEYERALPILEELAGLAPASPDGASANNVMTSGAIFSNLGRCLIELDRLEDAEASLLQAEPFVRHFGNQWLIDVNAARLDYVRDALSASRD